MKKFLLFVAIFCFASFNLDSATAKSVFLPDWMEPEIGGGSGNDFSRDENWCATAVDAFGNTIYHKAVTCPVPKIFDEYCDHSSEWISECYCPPEYNLRCDAPLRGNSRYSCDGLWASCCDTTCPSGYSLYHPGGCPSTSRNNCGDTCYGPYAPCCYPASSESGCSCGTYTCGDGCGGSRTCCSACPDPEPDPGSGGSSNSGSSNSGSSNSGSGSSDPCAGTSCPSAKSCSKCKNYSTATSCCKRVCTECEAEDPCAGKSCPSAKSCSHGCKTSSSKTDCCASVCTECNPDPCAGKTCPTAKNCPHGCKTSSSATSCCSSVCTECKEAPCTKTCNGYDLTSLSQCPWHPYAFSSCMDCNGVTRYKCWCDNHNQYGPNGQLLECSYR